MGIFDDFLAIQPAQGNVSTLSYPDYVISTNSLVSSTSTQFVICKLVGGNETNMISNP